MTWRRVPLLLMALAALSACSSGVPSASSSPASAGASPSGAASPAPASASAAGGTATPSTSALPSQATSPSQTSIRTGRFTEVFVTPLPSGAAQAAVVSDFRQAMITWNTSQENVALVSSVTRWVTGTALKDLRTTLTRQSQSQEVPIGVDRLYLTRVTALTPARATIAMCDDGAGWVWENPRTGAVDPTSTHLPIDEQYALITWGMVPLDGHWALASVSSVSPPAAPARPCLP